MTLTRVPEYRNPVGIGEVIMREIADKNYQAKLLLYENLEALVRVLPRDLAVLQNDRKIELHPYQTNSWWYLGFNQAKPPLDDPAVREAIAHMVDRESLLAPIGTGEVLSGPFVRSSPFYNHEVTPRTADTDRVAALLEGAGYARSDAGWSRRGKPLAFTLAAHRSLESSQEVVINLQSQLKAQGVAVEIEFLDEATWKGRIWRERSFELILSQWSFDRNEDVREQFHSRGQRNFTGYASGEADRLLDLSRSTLDPQEKKQALRDLHRVVHADVPMVFLWTLDSYSAMNVRVDNVIIHPFYFFTWIRDWQLK